MKSSIFIQGLWIGLSIAIPVGPIGVLCIRRSISSGRWVGFACGLGAATADAIYGAIAAFGLTLIAEALTSQRSLLQLVGSIFLCYLGIQTYRSKPATSEAPVKSGNGFKSFGSTLLLTLTNPMTIVGFTGLFAGAGLATTKPSPFQAMLMVCGVFLGSAAWWLILSWGASRMKDRVSSLHLQRLNKGSGLFIGAYGVWQLFQFLRNFK
jgi:threonine/homoserine/homoserine lactone efflux protein